MTSTSPACIGATTLSLSYSRSRIKGSFLGLAMVKAGFACSILQPSISLTGYLYSIGFSRLNSSTPKVLEGILSILSLRPYEYKHYDYYATTKAKSTAFLTVLTDC